MSSRDYHVKELNIAQNPDDPRHVMPIIGPDHWRILDVGCGAGQTLIASNLNPDVVATGIDIDFEALALGRELSAAVAFVAGEAEKLPFADASFDLVLARVVLPLTHIPHTIGEISRVVGPGGDIWLVLHPISRTLQNLWDSLRQHRLKNAIYRLYVLANGLLFEATGQLFPFPLNGHYESFQTCSSITRQLQQAGFGNIEIDQTDHFVVTATKL
ncbi:MAG: class I SAM-dependent methyltransferase [Chloroflexota bacterium]|nr:class I SAM-dependent methyltransferase [Chloroflexota bacterium]